MSTLDHNRTASLCFQRTVFQCTRPSKRVSEGSTERLPLEGKPPRWFVHNILTPSDVQPELTRRGDFVQFKKQLAFLKKRGDEGSFSDPLSPFTGDRDRELSPPQPFNRHALPRAPSSGVDSQDSHISPSDLSLAERSDDYLQTKRGIEACNQDPLGLKVIHKPPGDRRVDIVFVHGLGGSSRNTWSKDQDPDFFWPLKFLPFEPGINEARISTFGYNANFRCGSGKNKMSVLDFAKDLLYDLKYAKDESVPELEDLGMGEASRAAPTSIYSTTDKKTETYYLRGPFYGRPCCKRGIVLLALDQNGRTLICLTGLQAYMSGQNDPTYEYIIRSVSSIIFLSTPHRGTDLAETLNRILQVSFVANPMQFISELGAGSQTLQKLNEQFRHVATKLQLVSFYETRPTPVFRKTQMMVLKKDSSILGYPGEISKPLDADHHGVCKYESPNDFRYITVRNVLKSLVGKSKPKDTRELHVGVGQASRVKFEEYLSVSESPDGDYNFFRDRWTSGTCDWILRDVAFSAWLEDTHSRPRVLWIHGNAASGKSILSSFLIHHLFQLGLLCHYFFIRFTDRKKRALSMILRSLACQLAHSTPPYADRLRLLEAAATDLRTADFRNIWQSLYKRNLFQLDIDYPLYWVIDGLDEADSPGVLIKLLSELDSTNIPLRVLIVSRKTHEISSAFQKLRKQVHMDAILMEGNRNDFRAYINREMDVAGEDSYREEITTQLLERARGNFLWVHLAVQEINDCHTKAALEGALKNLSPGMEALYDRMSVSVRTQPSSADRELGQSILGWTTCAQRSLSIGELSDALRNDGLLEIHRTIGDLCGGFVIVGKDKVTMIHETAREYLMRGGDGDRPLAIDRKPTHDKLFSRCIECLTDPKLRSQINRNQPPALLDYATSAWFIHFSIGPATHPRNLEIVEKFLRGPNVLTWIHIAARKKELRALVIASRYLTDVILKLRKLSRRESLAHQRAIAIIEGWATDIVKIVGKFGNTLIQNPDSIYRLISPFCPQNSAIYLQFGRKESKALQVSGLTNSAWDDCLARLSLGQGVMASAVLTAGNRIVILSTIRNSSQIIIYNSATFEEQGRIVHPERVFSIQVNMIGNLLVSYGYVTTRVWDIATGDCIKTVKNPVKRPRPQSLLFVETEKMILVGSEDRCIRSFSLDDNSAEYETRARIDEQSLEDRMVNFPTCSALSPDGNMVAFGYRQHPVTVWELEPPWLLGQCNITLDATDMTIRETTWGEVFRITWHPFSGEIFGLTQTGLLFKWDPCQENSTATVQTGGDCLTVSRDGSLVATGDAVGMIKVYATPDLSLLYQLTSPNSILDLSFSTDSRRLYDVREAYGNIWEPNTLVRLADSSDYHDHNNDALSENESLTKLSLHTEHHFTRVDDIVIVSGQSLGPLYCYGTEDGLALLCEVGRGKVCELERSTSYMSIEQAAWSEDGSLVAIADLSGRLSLKRIAKAGQARDAWQVKHEFDLVISPHEGHIGQLVFQPAGHQLLASTTKTLYSVDLKSRDLVTAKVPPGLSKVKWTSHPTLPDYLMGFGTTKVHVLTWADLREVRNLTFSPFQIKHPATSSLSQTLQSHIALKRDSETLGRLVANANSPHVLLQISYSATSSQPDTQYLVFKVADILSDPNGDDTNTTGNELPYTLLPAHIASRIREPLAFLSHKGLVFLDVDRWICTWRLPSSAPRQRSEVDGGEIEQCYFLPGDWVTANEGQLSTVMPDGTLLCPQNGEVAAVQCVKLRE